MRIVGVHGVGNHQAGLTPSAAASRLSAAWVEAIAAGPGAGALRDVDLRVAYYAHHLHTVTAQGAGDLDAVDDDTAALVTAWGVALGAPAELTQGPATVPLRLLADWVARRFGLNSRMVRWFVALFFEEVATYLASPDSALRAAARDEVAAVIAEHRPDVVVAHSLGTVVTYEALGSRPDLEIDLLITLGSPLGMPDVVYDRLRPAPASLVSPGRLPGVRRWVNVADIGDLVAIPRSLGSRFATDADFEETVALFDFHRARAYLGTDRVRDLLLDPLLGR